MVKKTTKKVTNKTKTMNASSANSAKELIDDLEVFGNPDVWQLICKASSKKEEWMKSTKAMATPMGCLVQVTTQQGDNIAEALTFIPGARIIDIDTKDKSKGKRFI